MGSVVVVVLVERWFSFARVLAVEQPTDVESQVATVVWVSPWRIFDKSGSEAPGGPFATGYTLFEAANPDAALPGASWLRRDLKF